MIESGTVVRASSNQVSCELNGEYVFLNVTSGDYFSLDGPGAFVWELVQRPRAVCEIIDSVLARYDVDVETCRAEVNELLDQLRVLGLVDTVDGAPA